MDAAPQSTPRRARVSVVVFATFIGLVVMALVEGALVAVLLALNDPKSTSDRFGFIFVGAFFALLVGQLPALLLGAPAAPK